MRDTYYRYDGVEVSATELKNFHGQYLQDKYVYENFFENYKEGTFIDIGAHDGISLSNTLFFEKEMNWRGLCIEPNPDVFAYLQKNRNTCIQAALSEKEEEVEFTKIKGYAQTLSGITKDYHKDYPERINEEINYFGGTKETLQVKTKTLNSILNEYKYEVIDFMSIDTEGSELSILKGLDFNRFKIRVIAMENNFEGEYHRVFMKERGYTFKERIKIDDIYYKL